jgi:hypothetical protein
MNVLCAAQTAANGAPSGTASTYVQLAQISTSIFYTQTKQTNSHDSPFFETATRKEASIFPVSAFSSCF